MDRFRTLTDTVAWHCTDLYPGGDPMVFEHVFQLILKAQGHSGQRPDHDEVERAIHRACYVIQRIEVTVLSRDDSDTRLAAAVQGPGDPSQPSTDVLVTLDDLCVVSRINKRTLERYRSDGKLPAPDKKGGHGKPDKWWYVNIRPRLEPLANRTLPPVYPGT